MPNKITPVRQTPQDVLSESSLPKDGILPTSSRFFKAYYSSPEIENKLLNRTMSAEVIGKNLKAADSFILAGDTNSAAFCYARAGYACVEMCSFCGHYDEKIYFFNLAVKNYKEAGDIFYKIRDLNSAAFCYARAGDAGDASCEFYVDLEEAKRVSINAAENYQRAGDAFLDIDKFEKAKQIYGKTAAQYIKSLNYFHETNIDDVEYFKLAAYYYGKSGDKYNRDRFNKLAKDACTSRISDIKNSDQSQTLPEKEKLAKYLELLAECYKLSYDEDKAVQSYQEAAELYSQLAKNGDKSIAAKNFNLAASCYYKAGQYEKSAETYKVAASLYFEANEKLEAAKKYAAAASLYFEANEELEAAQNYGAAAILYSDANEKLEAAQNYGAAAILYSDANEKEKAAQNYEFAARLYSEDNEKEKAADNYEFAARLYSEANQNEKAAETYEFAARLYSEANQNEKAAQNYEAVASLYFEANEKLEAAKKYAAAARLYSDANQNEKAAQNYESAAIWYLEAGECEKAADNYESAAKLYSEANQNEKAANNYEFAAICYFKADKTEKAAKTYESAAKLYSEANQIKDVADSYACAGKCYSDVDKKIAAAECFELAAKFYSNVDKKIAAAQCFELAGKYYSDVDKKIAAQYYQSAAEIFLAVDNKQKAAECFNLAGNTFFAIEDNQNAAKCFEKCGNFNRAGNAYEKLGEYYRFKKQDSSLASINYKAAAKNFLLTNDDQGRENAAKCYTCAADIDAKNKDIQSSKIFYKTAAGIYEFLAEKYNNNLAKAAKFYKLAADCSNLAGGTTREVVLAKELYTKAVNRYIDVVENKNLNYSPEELAEIYNLFATCFSNLGLTKNAADNYRLAADGCLRLADQLKSQNLTGINSDILVYINRAVANYKLAAEHYNRAGDFDKAVVNCELAIYALELVVSNDDTYAKQIINFATLATETLGKVKDMKHLAAKYYALKGKYLRSIGDDKEAGMAYKYAAERYKASADSTESLEQVQLEDLEHAAYYYDISGNKLQAQELYASLAKKYLSLRNKADTSVEKKAYCLKKSADYFRLCGKWRDAYENYKNSAEEYENIVKGIDDGVIKTRMQQLAIQAKSEMAYAALECNKKYKHVISNTSSDPSVEDSIKADIAAQIRYLESKLDDRAKVMFRILLDIHNSESKYNLLEQETIMVLGYSHVSTAQMCLIAILSGMANLSTAGLDDLADILNQEAKMIAYLNLDDLREFEQRSDIKDKLHELERQIVYRRGIYSIVFTGDCSYRLHFNEAELPYERIFGKYRAEFGHAGKYVNSEARSSTINRKIVPSGIKLAHNSGDFNLDSCLKEIQDLIKNKNPAGVEYEKIDQYTKIIQNCNLVTNLVRGRQLEWVIQIRKQYLEKLFKELDTKLENQFKLFEYNDLNAQLVIDSAENRAKYCRDTGLRLMLLINTNNAFIDSEELVKIAKYYQEACICMASVHLAGEENDYVMASAFYKAAYELNSNNEYLVQSISNFIFITYAPVTFQKKIASYFRKITPDENSREIVLNQLVTVLDISKNDACNYLNTYELRSTGADLLLPLTIYYLSMNTDYNSCILALNLLLEKYRLPLCSASHSYIFVTLIAAVNDIKVNNIKKQLEEVM